MNPSSDRIVARILGKRQAEGEKSKQAATVPPTVPAQREKAQPAQAKGKEPMPPSPPKKKMRSATELPTDIYKARPGPKVGQEGLQKPDTPLPGAQMKKTLAKKTPNTPTVDPVSAKKTPEVGKVVDLTGDAPASKGETVPSRKEDQSIADSTAFSPALGLKSTDSVFKNVRPAQVILLEGRLPEDIAYTAGLGYKDFLRRSFMTFTQVRFFLLLLYIFSSMTCIDIVFYIVIQSLG